VEFFYLFLQIKQKLPGMAPFIGEYACKVDAKGRIIFPSAFKKQLSIETGNRFVVKRDIFEKCLLLFPFIEWERQMKIIRSRTNIYNQEHNRFLRMFYQGTAEMVVDGNSRILIPKRLLDFAGIKNEVILAGQFGKIEIWNPEFYHAASEDSGDFAKLAQEILGKFTNEPERE
jgi:MraZ protein